MKLIILGLKSTQTGTYAVYDVTRNNQHIPIGLNETKEIPVLSPFPFSSFTSNDDFDENQFERCYLEVEGELSDAEFSSMQSGGIVYYRFEQRTITLLNQYHDIFQYALQLLRKFGKQLGTYDLLTWVIHNETKNEDEFNAMKKIILEGVRKKENKRYPLDISLDRFTLPYLDYFRELSEKGYHITFGRYGTMDQQSVENIKELSDETFLYLIEQVTLYDTSFLTHPLFTPVFYETHVKGKPIEAFLFCDIEPKEILALQQKGFAIEALFHHVFQLTLQQLNEEFPEYNGDFFLLFSDPDCVPYIKRVSPLDYYCCEDCDGYDIYEQYSEEELAGTDVLVDERPQYVQRLIEQWGDFLSPAQYPLFDRVPVDVLKQFPKNRFFQGLIATKITQ